MGTEGATPALRWRSTKGDASVWRELQRAPADNLGFEEAASYVFECPGEAWSLRVDDEPLSHVAGSATLLEWQPGFFAGEVTAELCDADGARRALFLLDVA